MKTYKQWEDSGMDFHHFIEPLDEIDEILYLHFGEIIAPKYCVNGLIQCGEAWSKYQDVYWYETFRIIKDRYYYLGIFPEFAQ